MAGLHKSTFENPVVNWIDTRLPIFTLMQKEYAVFPTPKNFNYFWNFGALAMISLGIMIVTGIFRVRVFHQGHRAQQAFRRQRMAARQWLQGGMHAHRQAQLATQHIAEQAGIGLRGGKCRHGSGSSR